MIPHSIRGLCTINHLWFKKYLFGGLILLCCGLAQADPLSNDEQLAEVMAEARQAMKEAQYNIAIKNYRQLTEMPDHAYRRDALELLGLAYERNGNIDEAQANYQHYLRIYPEGIASERVRQRLAGLTTAAWEAPKPLKKAKQQQKSAWRTYGSFSQYLRRDASSFEQQSEVVHNYALSTRLDISNRGKTDAWDIRSRFSSGYTLDLQGDQENQQQLSYLYLDMQQRQGDWGFRLGRQRANGGGVLGRFDGLNLTRKLNKKHQINLLLGMPVERTSDTSPDSSRYFYGLNLQIAASEYWQTSGYLIEQRYDGLLDRRAVGGELRYLHTERTLYTLLDYDIDYGVLNIANLQASIIFKNKSSLNLLLDYRASPAITTGNALIGQQISSLKALQNLYSEAEIRQLAEQRTPHNYLASLGMSKQLNEQVRLDLDISANNLTATPTNPGTRTEYFMMGRVTWSTLWRKGDINMLSLRLADTDNSQATTLTLNSRQPINGWRLTPRLQWDQRDYQNGDKQTTLAPGIRIDYQWQGGHLFEFDAGWEVSQRQTWLGDQEHQNSYYSLGYRWQF